MPVMNAAENAAKLNSTATTFNFPLTLPTFTGPKIPVPAGFVPLVAKPTPMAANLTMIAPPSDTNATSNAIESNESLAAPAAASADELPQ